MALHVSSHLVFDIKFRKTGTFDNVICWPFIPMKKGDIKKHGLNDKARQTVHKYYSEMTWPYNHSLPNTLEYWQFCLLTLKGL